MLVSFFYLLGSVFLTFQHSLGALRKSSLNYIEFNDNNASSITITSFLFNTKPLNSPWVDRIFGSKSVYFNNSVHWQTRQNSIDTTSIISFGIDFLQSYLHLNPSTFLPQCSFEFLGTTGDKMPSPFNNNDIRYGPVVGTANLTIESPKVLQEAIPEAIQCYYRALHSRWSFPQVFFPVIYFCPISTYNKCKQLISVTHKLTKEQAAATRFAVKTNKPFVRQNQKQPTDAAAITTSYFSPKFMIKRSSLRADSFTKAACLVIPFESKDKSLFAVHGAMISEWIRYYNLLGFKTIVYDSHGKFRDHIFDDSPTSYNRVNHIKHDSDSNHSSRLQYHDFTYLQLLSPTERLSHDFNSESVPIHFQRLVFDKEVTLTHCRFEARVLYGIEDVIATDFDEFLLCPSQKRDFTMQRQYIDTHINNQKQEGNDVIHTLTHLLSNPTGGTIRECLTRQIGHGNQSIFNCWHSINYLPRKAQAPYSMIKSIHLGLKCPLTTIHHSCGGIFPFAYDCLCEDNIEEVYTEVGHYHGHHFVREGPGKEACVMLHHSTDNNKYQEVNTTTAKKAAAKRKEINQKKHHKLTKLQSEVISSVNASDVLQMLKLANLV